MYIIPSLLTDMYQSILLNFTCITIAQH